MLDTETAPLEALGRLCAIAKCDTGQSRRIANFLLAWHNAEENGGWDPTDLWNVDSTIAEDLLTVLKLARESRRYPGDLGFEPEIRLSGNSGVADPNLAREAHLRLHDQVRHLENSMRPTARLRHRMHRKPWRYMV